MDQESSGGVNPDLGQGPTGPTDPGPGSNDFFDMSSMGYDTNNAHGPNVTAPLGMAEGSGEPVSQTSSSTAAFMEDVASATAQSTSDNTQCDVSNLINEISASANASASDVNHDNKAPNSTEQHDNGNNSKSAVGNEGQPQQEVRFEAGTRPRMLQLTAADIKGELIQDDSEDEDFRPEAFLTDEKSVNKDKALAELSSDSCSSGVTSNSDEEDSSSTSADSDDLLLEDDIDTASTSTSQESSDDDDDDDDDDDEEEEVVYAEGFGSHFLLDKQEVKPSRFDDDDFVWEGGLWSPAPSLASSQWSDKKKKKNRRRRDSFVVSSSDEEEYKFGLSSGEDFGGYDSDYAKPKNKKGRGRPRKGRRVFKPDDPNYDWDINFKFTCELCKEVVVGFQRSVEHMDKKHPLAKSKSQAPTPLLETPTESMDSTSQSQDVQQQQQLAGPGGEQQSQALAGGGLPNSDSFQDQDTTSRQQSELLELSGASNSASIDSVQTTKTVPKADSAHQDDDDKFQCILCLRPFGRKDHLKRHVSGHVDGRIPYGEEAMARQRRAGKGEDLRGQANRAVDDWSTLRTFHCHLCQKETKGFRAAWMHMRERHPVKASDQVHDDLSEGEGSSEFAFERPASAAKSERSDIESIKKEPTEDSLPGQLLGALEEVQKEQQQQQQQQQQGFQQTNETTSNSFQQLDFTGALQGQASQDLFQNQQPLEVQQQQLPEQSPVLTLLESSSQQQTQSSSGLDPAQDPKAMKKEEALETAAAKAVDKLFSFQCIFCSKAYSRREHLKMHVWRHVNTLEPTPMHAMRGYTKSWAEITMWSCRQCPHLGEKFAGLTAFINHNKSDHGMPLGLVCPVCGKDNYTKKDHLKTHVNTHNEVKLPCEFCGKLFADGNKMKRHVNEVHEKLKNFMCNTCGKCFARKDKLRAHELGVHSNAVGNHRPYLCHICGRGFGRQEHVYRHQKICGQRQKEKQELLENGTNPGKEMQLVGLELGVHNIERDVTTGMFHCKECNHAFKNKRYIAEHYARNHRVENLKLPYRCNECGRGYKIMRDLIRHQKKPHVHKGNYMQKAFVCEIDGCGRRFGREFELKRHEKIHQGIKEHKCDRCDAEFHLRNCLKTHYKNVHDLELPKSRRRARMSSDEEDSVDKKRRKKKGKAGVEDDRIHGLNGQDTNESDRAASANGALNLSSNNPVTSTADQWIPQGLNQGYFGQNPLQTGFAHWMSVGLDQPTMVPSSSNYYQGANVAGNVTPLGSFQKETEDSNHSFANSQNRNSPNPLHQLQRDSQAQVLGHQSSAGAKLGMSLLSDSDSNSNSKFDDDNAKKKRKNQGTPMTEEERSAYEDTISEKKLGAICTVCGKVFRNRDALDFHIMTTKMPNHGVLQIQKMKSNYAFASMQVEAKLRGVTRTGNIKTDVEEEAQEAKAQIVKQQQPVPSLVNDEPNESLNVEPEVYIDPRTGDFKVKQEPSFTEEPIPEQPVVVAPPAVAGTGPEVEAEEQIPPNPADFLEQQENDKENEIVEMPVKVTIKAEPGDDDANFKVPEGPAKKAKKFGKRKIFKCMECEKGFKKQSKLIKHVMKRHQERLEEKAKEQASKDIHELTKNAKDSSGRWPCSICGKSLANKQKLQRHIMEVHQKLRNHICRLCHKGFARAEKLRQHELDNHDEEELKKVKPIPVPSLPVMKKEPLFKNGPQLILMPMGCLDCKLQFEDKDDIMQHMMAPPHNFREDQTDDIECPILTCNLKFTSVGRLSQHLRVGKHNQPCPSCGKKFKRLDKLEIHLRCHSSDRPFACDMCDKAYKDPTSLMFHKKTHTGARPYLCPDCGAGFMKPDHLKRHVNSTHLKIKNIKCQFCDMHFSDKYKARIHERKHTGETPYLCSVCAKGFKRKEALDQHAIIHKDLPRDFKCIICSATFKSQQYLNRHVSRHYAEKRWKCTKCPSAFIDKRDLVTHDKHVHQNLRPFVCEHCASAYKTKQGLQIHMKAYPTGDCINMKRFSGRGANRIDMTAAQAPDEDDDPNVEKPFECPQCQKRFSKKNKLDWHIRMHSNVRPFPCTIEGCNRSFTQNQTLRTHLKQFHQIDLPPMARGGRKRQATDTPTSVSVSVPTLPLASHTQTPSPPLHQPPSLDDVTKNAYQRNFLEDRAREAALRDAREQAMAAANNSMEKSMQKLRQPPAVPQITPRFPPELLPRLDMLAAQTRTPPQNVVTSNQGRAGVQIPNQHGRHPSGDHSNGIPQFMLQHQQQLFQQQQQQQHQRQHQLLQQQQHQQLQQPLGLQQQNQPSAFPGMPPNFNPGRDVDQNLSANHPSPLDFYQYAAANFANINMYRN